jgi:hypothetical protein
MSMIWRSRLLRAGGGRVTSHMLAGAKMNVKFLTLPAQSGCGRDSGLLRTRDADLRIHPDFPWVLFFLRRRYEAPAAHGHDLSEIHRYEWNGTCTSAPMREAGLSLAWVNRPRSRHIAHARKQSPSAVKLHGALVRHSSSTRMTEASGSPSPIQDRRHPRTQQRRASRRLSGKLARSHVQL